MKTLLQARAQKSEIQNNLCRLLQSLYLLSSASLKEVQTLQMSTQSALDFVFLRACLHVHSAHLFKTFKSTNFQLEKVKLERRPNRVPFGLILRESGTINRSNPAQDVLIHLLHRLTVSNSAPLPRE